MFSWLTQRYIYAENFEDVDSREEASDAEINQCFNMLSCVSLYDSPFVAFSPI
jgi:hypothetical protein